MQIVPFISTLFIIGLAELGDKTQLLTIALASKYPMDKVIYGVFSASAVLMLIAVAAGEIVQKLFPPLLISIFAGSFFIIYGLMIVLPLSKKETEEKESRVDARNPFLAVFVSFFLAELGDKTQLAAFALAAKYRTLFMVWLGATLAMVIINLFGILIGNILRNYLPEKKMNYISGIIFIVFGVITFLGTILKI